MGPVRTRMANTDETPPSLRGAASRGIAAGFVQQAARVSDHTAFFYMGELVEYDTADVIFTKPSSSRTEDYITGRFG